MKVRSSNSQSGISLVEVIISAAILIVFVGGISSVYVSFLKTSSDGALELKSYYLLEEGIEAVKTLRDNSWSTNIDTLATSTDYYLEWSGTAWSATTTEQVIDGFYRSFSLEDVYRDGNDDIAVSGTLDPDTKKVVIDIAWSERGATSTDSLETYMANIFEN